MSNTSRITTKGQVTIPQDLREAFGMLPGTDVKFRKGRNAITLVKTERTNGRPSRGDDTVALLRNSGHGRMSTDEILKLMRGDD